MTKITISVVLFLHLFSVCFSQQHESIYGSSSVCQGQKDVVYMLHSVTNTINYTWTYTGKGFSIGAGTGTNAIRANFSDSATSGILTVHANNACGGGITSPAFSVTINPLPAVPLANAATNVTQNSFSANWTTVSGATSYYLDVATNASFTFFVTGYNNLNVGNVQTQNIATLTCGTTYYYRVRAANNCGISSNSNIITVITSACCIPNTWTQKADFGGIARFGAVGFSIGTKGYIGTGYDGAYKKDFWEYDPSTNSWTQKADFSGTARSDAVGFSIGNKGYIGTGWDGATAFKDFYEYNPNTNIWTQKADGTARVNAVGFSIGTKGYIGTGINGVGGYKKDLWEYDTTANSWTKKTDFGGTARCSAVGFSIGSKGYIGTGVNGITLLYKDFWEYDSGTNSWTQKMDFGGTARAYTIGFSIGNRGYVGTGWNGGGIYKQDFWVYDPSSNAWIQKTDFGGTAIEQAVGFFIGSKGYIGTGWDGTYKKDFWEYCP